MKSIKSKKWYQNQIAARKNAVGQLAMSIDNPFTTNVLRLTQAAMHNHSIQAQCKIIYAEINDLEYEFSLYYRR